MAGNQPLGILPVPRQVGQVSAECPFPFMAPYEGKCFRVFAFSISFVRSGPSMVLTLCPGVTMTLSQVQSKGEGEQRPIKAWNLLLKAQ